MRRGATLAATRDARWRLIEAGLNEAAVGLALWAECLGTLAATAIAVGDAMELGAPVVSGSGYVWAEIGVGAAAGRDREGR